MDANGTAVDACNDAVRFAIGLLNDPAAKVPAYRIGITTPMVGKWHCLGTVTVR
ncbi:MAG: hypothetical protein NTW21_08320 [Verrucomicrobia bacterium]|nr:hypothetical protein [Verrucomicrobiota bacterium]